MSTTTVLGTRPPGDYGSPVPASALRRALATTIPVSTLPRASSTIVVTLCVLASLTPSLLPRSALTQALFTGVLAAAGLGMLVLVRRLRQVLTRSSGSRVPRESVRLLALLGAMVTTTWAMVAADHWQDSLRQVMGMSSVGPGHWMQVILGAVATFVVVVAAGATVSSVAHRLGWIGSATTAVVLATGLQLVAGPAVWEMMSRSYSDSNDVVDVSSQRPMSAARAGSPESVVSWESLGRQGRRFVAAGEQSGSIRTYVGMNSAPDVKSRAALAVSELERAGGFARSAIVVTIPTGSGWIDENAAEGFEDRFDDDVAIVGLQYSYAPSWITFVFGRSAAAADAAALFDAVADRITALPDAIRPALYVYGQSLGSVGGSAQFTDAADLGRRACGALWAGPPAGSVMTDGATVLANTSDPVVWWSPDLILRRPDLSRAVADAPVPQWIPGLTFLQASVDLVSALNFPAGHGHRYGKEQGTALPDCDLTR
ncbi:alpha/beta-hydrolase family protein [Rhodococcus sp. NPDC019627]|uniref:alpha/beta-hydrolase family protein n=1 Tax=unclassified Rhodococcus (in: high G+C Gram-positive bacteria) TaxID=192944 RepID=UPI0034108DC1